jgi:hypothetical protein
MKNRSVVLAALLLAVVALVLVAGCSKSSSPVDGKPPVQTPQDPDKAQALVTAANKAFAQKMDMAINYTLVDPDSSFRPRDIDFSTVHVLYDSAANMDTTNQDAKFGSAFTGILVFLADPDFNTFVDDVKNLADTSEIFKAPGIPRFDMGGPEVITGIPFFPGRLAGIMPNLSKLDRATQLAATATASGSPTIGRLQTILETQLLPNLEQARQLLEVLLEDPEYAFVITPAMQGNPGADTIVITHPDMHVFCATIEAIEASLYVFFSRNLDLSSYSVAGVNAALSQNSSFLDIKPGKMALAKDHLFKAMASADTALSAYIAKANANANHNHDLVKVYAKDVPNLHKVQDSLRAVRGWFNGPIDRWIKWSTGSYYTMDTVWVGQCEYCYWIDYQWHETFDSSYLKIDISKFFDSPIDNPKRLLPGYALTMTELPDLYKQFAAAHFSRSKYWDSLASIYQAIRPNDTSYDLQGYGFRFHMPETDNDAFYNMLAGNGVDYFALQFVFGWDDLQGWYTVPPYNKYLYYWSSQHLWRYCDLYGHPFQLETRFTWSANDYASWTFPEPTFSGLLPSLTSDEIKRILNVQDGWRKVNCDTTGLPD